MGPRTSGTLLFDLHPAAVAQLAGKGCIHHRGIHVGADVAFRRQLGGIDICTKLADGCGNSIVADDRRLHCVSFRAGEGARYVAKPFAAAALAGAGIAAGFSGVDAGVRLVRRNNAIRSLE